MYIFYPCLPKCELCEKITFAFQHFGLRARRGRRNRRKNAAPVGRRGGGDKAFSTRTHLPLDLRWKVAALSHTHEPVISSPPLHIGVKAHTEIKLANTAGRNVRHF